MEKRKVIAAYRRGFITLEECAQIMGVDHKQMNQLVKETSLFMYPQEKAAAKSAVQS